MTFLASVRWPWRIYYYLQHVGAVVVVVRRGLTHFNFQKDKLCEDSKYDDTG